MYNQLQHHGVRGQHWGVRKTKSSPSQGVTHPAATKEPISAPKKKTVKDMSDAELTEKVNRLNLEKRYKDAVAAEESAKISKGRKFIAGVLEQSGKQVATQITTYAMGNAVNKIMKAQVVNVKNAEKK